MDRYKVFPSGEMGMHPAGNWTPYADAQATVEALQAQLPAEMQGCTILFKECEKGHGRLVATNWRDHGCQTCAMEALQRERDEFERERDQLHAALMEAKAALDAEREKVEALQAQVSELQGIADEKCRCFLERAEQSEKQLTQRTAELEALQAEKLMLERGVSAQSALIDGLQSQLIKRTADLEAVQHERDEANSHVKFLGATKQANGSFCLDMKKYHARHRCGRHRDDPWKGIDTEIDCFVCLKHALDAERERSKKQAEEAMVVFSKLSQLQALVRALPVVRIDLNDAYHDTLLARPEDEAVKELLRYRATLDATTPATMDAAETHDRMFNHADRHPEAL